jgi:hypothetical protein
MRTTLTKVRLIILVALSIACCCEMAVFALLRRGAEVYKSGTALAVPQGISVSGMFLEPRAAACFVIRVTADGCPYCKQDSAHYERIAQEAHSRGCVVVAVAPEAGQMKATGSSLAVELEYVDMKLGRALDTSLTPQTLLIGPSGVVLWQRQGAMNGDDERNAISAVSHVGMAHTDTETAPTLRVLGPK